MPDTVAEKGAAPRAQDAGEKSQAAPASEPKQGADASGAHGGAYTLVRELAAAAGGAQEPPPDKLSHVFRKSEFSNPVNDEQKARALSAMQQQYGNRYVQRVLSPEASAAVAPLAPRAHVQRREAQGAAAGEPAEAPHIEGGGGRPLDSDTQDFMGSRLNHDFGGVRVHDDGHAHQASKALNADAFTTGRDIYFSQGAYNPASQAGQKLLAHELAHVVQQDRGVAGGGAQGFSVSHPSDPLERQADAASEAVMRGEMFPALTASAAPVFQRQASGTAAPAPAPAATTGADAATVFNDFTVHIAGASVVLPVKDLLKKAVPGNKLSLPANYLKKVPPIPAFKLTEASLDLDDAKMPTGATLAVAVNVPPLDGQGTVSVDKDGNASGTAHVVFRGDKIPGLKQTELDVTVSKKDFAFDASIDFDLPKVTGNLKYKYQDHKHSGKGTALYEGAKMKGGIEIIMSEAGLISGSGMLEMELFKGLKGEAEVAVDEERNVGVKGKLSVPGQIELFPEKKYEKNFFSFEKKFPIWGIVIPVIDVNVGIFGEIHAGAGFRSKFGPGVLRDIALTGEFGTDPEAATEFGLGGEFFVPAGAEIVANVGGGIGLGLAVADITGGVEAVGVAGLYTALTVRPNFKYSGGKYTISGMAELAGVAQLKFGINAFAKIDVGVWLFKGTVWRKDWTLAEWVWDTGLNIALRANISYTLGEDFAPDISFETGQIDPEKFIKDVMPESGTPVPAPPKPPVPEKGAFIAEGAQGTQDTGAAPGEAPAPPTPGSPPAKTTPGTAPAPGTAPGGEPGATPAEGQAPGEPATEGEQPPVPDVLPPAKVQRPFSLTGEGHTLTAISQNDEVVIMMASPQAFQLRQLIKDAINEVTAAEGIEEEDKSHIRAVLRDVWERADPKDIGHDWKARQHADRKLGVVEYEHFLDVSLARITSELINKNDIIYDLFKVRLTNLDKLKTPVPPLRFLPHDFRGSVGKEKKHWVRINLYERFGSWDSTRAAIGAKQRGEIRQRVEDVLKTKDSVGWLQLIREFKIEKNLFMQDYLPTATSSLRSQAQKAVNDTYYALDHITPLARHWTEKGNNADDDERRAKTFEETNLNLITFEENSRKGAEGANYIPYVKSDFTSTIAAGGAKSAKTILSQKFLDEQDKEIP